MILFQNYVFTTNRTDSWCDFLIPFGFPVIFERITFPPSENQVSSKKIYKKRKK